MTDNREHIELLKRDITAWNKWRDDDSSPRTVDLYKADLSGADLQMANLSGADLQMANLERTNLMVADLFSADLSRAILSKANLRGAVLARTNFTNANLDKTEFSHAITLGTTFAGVNLSRAIGLERCVHSGPSFVDSLTLQMSGSLPREFLQGCGLPDLLIDYLPSIFDTPIQFHSTFISYSNDDKEFAERIYDDMRSNGVQCWFAPEDMKIGDRIRTRLDEVIYAHDKLVLVLSENSIKSDWVEKEVETAFAKERKSKRTVLFPIRIDDTVLSVDVGWPADIQRTRLIGDFRNWEDADAYAASFARLLRDLQVPY